MMRAKPSCSNWPALPAGARWAIETITTSAELRPAVAQVLERVAIADSTQVAETIARSRLGITAVTSDGDVYAPGWVRGGSASGPRAQVNSSSLLRLAAAKWPSRSPPAEQAIFELAQANAERARVNEIVEAALEKLHESDARMSAVAERLGSLATSLRTARAEIERAERSIADVEAALAADEQEHKDYSERLIAAQEAHPEDADPSTEERDRLEAVARAARAAETEVRLGLRTREERARAILDRATALERAAEAEEAARQRHKERLERRAREARVAAAVRTAAEYAVGFVTDALAESAELRERAEAERAERDTALSALRKTITVLQNELKDLTDSVHRDEMARAQQRLRIETLQTKAIEELGVDPEALVDEYGPHQFVQHIPDSDAPEDADIPEPAAYVREVQEKRLRAAERKLSALGRINPLALEEFTALEERHKFLTTQLEDLRNSKRDLLEIVKDVDERVEKAFAEAFAETAVQFERVFQRLFPGGTGRLVLTDPNNMLTTGLEVEAAPPAKKIKRLSLLSGGERSLVAVALLVAIFKARPSPFYIMDEVEAALDDSNLGRLITLFEELRDSSQLIVITHQKKTMEIADALYGVSMRGDGVTTVVSQRLRDIADQPAK